MNHFDQSMFLLFMVKGRKNTGDQDIEAEATAEKETERRRKSMKVNSEELFISIVFVLQHPLNMVHLLLLMYK